MSITGPHWKRIHVHYWSPMRINTCLLLVPKRPKRMNTCPLLVPTRTKYMSINGHQIELIRVRYLSPKRTNTCTLLSQKRTNTCPVLVPMRWLDQDIPTPGLTHISGGRYTSRIRLTSKPWKPRRRETKTGTRNYRQKSRWKSDKRTGSKWMRSSVKTENLTDYGPT